MIWGYYLSFLQITRTYMIYSFCHAHRYRMGRHLINTVHSHSGLWTCLTTVWTLLLQLSPIISPLSARFKGELDPSLSCFTATVIIWLLRKWLLINHTSLRLYFSSCKTFWFRSPILNYIIWHHLKHIISTILYGILITKYHIFRLYPFLLKISDHLDAPMVTDLFPNGW